MGAQLHVSLGGEVVADVAWGLARPGVPMAADTLMPWMSCTKLATAVAFAIAWERGLVALDAPHSERDLGRIIPGGNGRGPMRELDRLLEMLLGGGRRGPARLLHPVTVTALTARHRTGLGVENWGHPPLDWGLGLMLDSKRACGGLHFYGYGAHASPRAFGHAGFLSSVAFADPEVGLGVALVFNGMPADHAIHTERQNAVCTAIYEDLGLARSPATGALGQPVRPA